MSKKQHTKLVYEMVDEMEKKGYIKAKDVPYARKIGRRVFIGC